MSINSEELPTVREHLLACRSEHMATPEPIVGFEVYDEVTQRVFRLTEEGASDTPDGIFIGLQISRPRDVERLITAVRIGMTHPILVSEEQPMV